MNDTPLFAVLPYVKTSGPVVIRGIQFRSSTDLAGLPPSLQDQLTPLLSMFFLRDDLRILRMTYTCLESTLDQEHALQFLQRLHEAQTLIAYLYSAPHPTSGEPFLHLEHSSLYLLAPDKVSSSDAELNEHLVEDLASSASSPQENVPVQPSTQLPRRVPGYTGRLNGNTFVSVAAGKRIYAPPPHFWLNVSQDLRHDLERIRYESRYWALNHIIAATDAAQPEAQERVFTALDWHNLSTSMGISEDAALVYLAIAFESLLKLEPGEELSKRFKETILILLGPVPRLDSWLEQFYRARSKIVHEGMAPEVMFYATEKDRLSKVWNGKEEAIAYRSLITYGRHIFRLCVNAILTGALLAEQSGLAALFVHNQQRLERICESLSNTSTPAEARLRSIAREVLALKEYQFDASKLVRLETILGAGKRILQAFLDTNPVVSVEVATLLQNMHLDASTIDETSAYVEQLLAEIRKPYQNTPQQLRGIQEDTLGVVWNFLEYAEGALLDWQIQHFERKQPSVGQTPQGQPPDTDQSAQEESAEVQALGERTSEERAPDEQTREQQG